MLFYRFKMTVSDKDRTKEGSGDTARLLELTKTENHAELEKKDVTEVLCECNDLLQGYIEPQKTFKAYFYRMEDGKFCGMAMIDKFNDPEATIQEQMTRFMKEAYGITRVRILQVVEMRAMDITKHQSIAFNKDILSSNTDSYLDDQGFDYMMDVIRGRTCFKADEIVDPVQHASLSHAKALSEAKEILAGPSVVEELDRIYSSENARRFLAHPVHYKVKATNMDAAMKIIRLITHALRVNNRLCGDRITVIKDIEDNCTNECALEHLMQYADGSTVVLQMVGNDEDTPFADGYTSVVEYFADLMSKCRQRTLFFFVELIDRPGFAQQMVNLMADQMDLIELREGDTEDVQIAAHFMEQMAAADEIDEVPDFVKILPEKPLYSMEDIQKTYSKWKKTFLRNDIYKAYRTVDVIQQVKTAKKETNYQILQNMIGLETAKAMVEDMIAFYSVEQMRTKMGLPTMNTARHMCFTGNPGTAKTTMARLVAGILREKGMLTTGRFLECGRKDLVGKYVGWTADLVSKKFRQAKGGVLFIDEAYSLVDGSHSFGDEAINTIVQEMENHRDDVIVIFAGYPDKMKELLDRNEGLRSRIAFHLDFPDYTADEMDGILALMAKDYHYTLSKKAKEKAHGLFVKISVQKDFGNGRYVRNILEHAMLNQAGRLAKTQQEQGELTKRQVRTLEADDFTDEFGVKTGGWKPKFGFGI